MQRLDVMRGVLIDTDADYDGYMAMLYLLKHPDIHVRGITVTGTGATHLTPGAINVSNMLTLLDNPCDLKIPVARGAVAPMIYSNTLPAYNRDAADNHYDVRFPGVNPYPVFDDALRFLREYLIKCADTVTVLCIGGGSNWGRLFELAKTDPQLRSAIAQKVERILMVGGNLLPRYVEPGAAGNIQDVMQPRPYYTNRVAEWNMFIDPLGAQLIFSGGVPITLIALNVASQVSVTPVFFQRLSEVHTPAAVFLAQVLGPMMTPTNTGDYPRFLDPLAACVLADATLVAMQTFNLRVEQALNEEEDRSGMIIVDDIKGCAVDVALTAKADDVYCQYLEVIALA